MSPDRATADVVVIGAGVIGSAVALELARRGRQVRVVDSLPAAGYGSTSASSAIVRFSYSTEAGVAMSYEGLHYWRDWQAHIGGGEHARHQSLAEYVNLPMLVPKVAGGHHETFLPLFDRLGVPYEDLDPVAAARRYPFVDFRRFGPPATLHDDDHPFWGEPTATHDGVVVMPEAGYITDPQLAALNLTAAALDAGAQFHFRTTVIAVERTAQQVTGVRLDDGTRVSSPVIVNAAGPHSRRINQMAGVLEQMPLSSRPLRREVYLVAAPRGVDFDRDGFSIGDVDTGVYMRAERGNNILLGSVEAECDTLEWLDDPDDCDDVVSQDGFRLHALRAARRLPGLGIPPRATGLVSMYDVTADWTPLYDRSDLDGFFLACGTSGNQFKNAPIAGHVMAELIVAIDDGRDHDHDPLVVHGPHTGLAIDTATFSRLRPLPTDGPANVFG